MLKITEAVGVRAFVKKPKPTLGTSVTVIAFPPRSEIEQGGIMGIHLSAKITPKSMGSKRVITTRALTFRKGRSLKTVLAVRLQTALMLRDALNRILDDSDIIKEVDDEPI